MKSELRRLAVLASGNGTTLQAIIDAIASNKLDSKIVIVVSDKKDAFALIRAQMAGAGSYVLQGETA